MSDLTQTYVNECFSYNANSGQLFWKQRPSHHYKRKCEISANKKRAGTIAGSVKKEGSTAYIYLVIGRKHRLKAHRIIYFMVTGKWPDSVDHIDGNGLNNKWSNLRSVSVQENMKNAKLSKNNKTGVSGVRWVERCNKYAVQISISGRAKHFGYFKTLKEAAIAVRDARILGGYHKNHGRVKLAGEGICKGKMYTDVNHTEEVGDIRLDIDRSPGH